MKDMSNVIKTKLKNFSSQVGIRSFKMDNQKHLICDLPLIKSHNLYYCH